MSAKTPEILVKMDYLFDLKQSGGQSCDVYPEILRGLIDIYGNQIGSKTDDEIQTFHDTLPATEQIFDNADMHPDLSIIQPYFNQVVEVKKAELHVQQNDGYAKVA